MALWLPWLLVLVLAAALAAVLGRLYADRVSERPGEAGQLERLDLLLGRLLGLHSVRSSDVGQPTRDEVCRAALDYACELVGSGRGSLMLLDKPSGELRISASKGLPDSMARTKLKPGEGVAGRVFQTGEPIFIADPETDPRYVRHQSGPESQEPIISLPLKIGGRVAGVLNIHRTDGAAPFSDLNMKFLSVLASTAAAALENLELYDDLHGFYLELVSALSRAMDMKDSYTHDHGERARKKARRIAEKLGLPERMVRHVEYAALMHDIGKIGVDDAILTKPGKLTPEEYEIMKKHPAIGHQILAPVRFLGPVAQIVLYHQEWFDGRGYPEGLKGEEIPLGSRIVAVIDAWDAMTSDRPYRKALGREKAVSELKRGAGTQFDPRVVEAFLALESAEWKGEPTVPLPTPKVVPSPVIKPGKN